jgi:hypothetical protein
MLIVMAAAARPAAKPDIQGGLGEGTGFGVSVACHLHRIHATHSVHPDWQLHPKGSCRFGLFLCFCFRRSHLFGIDERFPTVSFELCQMLRGEGYWLWADFKPRVLQGIGCCNAAVRIYCQHELEKVRTLRTERCGFALLPVDVGRVVTELRENFPQGARPWWEVVTLGIGSESGQRKQITCE